MLQFHTVRTLHAVNLYNDTVVGFCFPMAPLQCTEKNFLLYMEGEPGLFKVTIQKWYRAFRFCNSLGMLDV